MIGLFASIFPIGGILGPNLGGFIIEHYGWREIFLVNVPLGILVVALLARQARHAPARPGATDAAPDRRARHGRCSPTMIVGCCSALTLRRRQSGAGQLAALLADDRRQRRAAGRRSSGRSGASPTRSSIFRW